MTPRVRQRTSMAMVIVGAIMVIVGLIDAVSGPEDTAVAAAPATEPPAPVAPSSSTSTTSTSTSAPTITTATSPPTTTLPAETVEEFVAAFTAALESGDAEFVFARLHPTTLATYGEDSCRATVQDQLLLISDYRITGPVSGPARTSVGGVTVPELYRAPVAFTFQGEGFEAEGSFAAISGEMRWFTQCN